MSSQNSKLMPNLDEKSTKQLNLTVLQRIDPFVEEILITAAHVTLYGFDIDTSQWSRKDVEGSLFVVKRNTQPRFQFIVMNRRNTDNLVEDLLGDFEYEVQVPYLLYRNATQEVSGIWFYNARECEEVANLFGRILNAYSKVPSKTKASSAKSEFEELEAVSSSTVMDDALESPPSTTTSVKNIPDDRSFVNFFSSRSWVSRVHQNSCVNTAESHATPMHSGKSSSSSTLPGVTTHPQVSASPSSEFAPTPFILPCSNTEPSNISSRSSTDLVKPSSFFGQPLSSSPPLMMPPVASSVPTAPPLYPPLQRHDHGAPLLQPFPPPTPPPSLTPASVSAPDYGVVISREKVGEALQMLVQDNQFIDMVYQKLLNAHQS